MALFYERLLPHFALHGVKAMNNKDLALTYAEKISRAIEQQQYEQAIEEIQNLRPIDIADLLALI